jgi:hypothetical protein
MRLGKLRREKAAHAFMDSNVADERGVRLRLPRGTG